MLRREALWSVMTEGKSEQAASDRRTIIARLEKIANGHGDFCRYCGKDGVKTRCSKCKKAHFCPSCVDLGWKYHKVWCS